MDSKALHRAVGGLLTRICPRGCTLVLDKDCGGDQHVPLFVSRDSHRYTACCKVDALLFDPDGVRAVVEVEESNLRPTQLCGKLLTTALATVYCHRRHNVIPMSRSVLFVQVLDPSRLKRNTAKLKQAQKLGDAISELLPLKRGSVTRYQPVWAVASTLVVNSGPGKQLFEAIRSHLSTSPG